MLLLSRALCRASAGLAAAAALAAAVPVSAVLERIQIVDTEFRTESGRTVWLNGINTAWIHWNDFGGGRFDRARWEAEFRRYAEAGINCARVWIDCDGEVAVRFDPDGRVSGPDDTSFHDVEALLEIAGRHAVRVLAVLTSFDHVKPTHPRHALWRRVFNEDSHLATYTQRVVEPLARRFSGHPALLAWEICNEPEWIWTNRWGVGRERVIRFHGAVAAALHRAGDKPVTTGSASWRWHADRRLLQPRATHPWSDASLAAAWPEPGARLDFFQVHYYDWMAVLGWSPYGRNASPSRFLKVVDRPVIIGETRGRYSWWTGRTVAQTYARGAANGYAGVFGWSAHGQDGHGNFEEIALATRAMAVQWAAAVAPSQGGVPEPAASRPNFADGVGELAGAASRPERTSDESSALFEKVAMVPENGALEGDAAPASPERLSDLDAAAGETT